MLTEAEGDTGMREDGERMLAPARSETSGMHGNSMRENRESLHLSFEDGTEERAGKDKILKPAMNGCRQSDSPILPAKPPNKDPNAKGTAEAVEGRGLTKGKAIQQNTSRTQCRANDVPNALDRIRQAAIRNKDEQFTALLHHITVERLRSAFYGIKKNLQPHASSLVHGKGRKERCLSLWKDTTSALRAWLAVRGMVLVPELFLNASAQPMTRSGFEYILHKHAHTAAKRCPSLSTKRVSPHVLRHTCALTVLQATNDLRKVSLWLGHSNMQTTEMYTRTDPSVKLETLESVIAPKLRFGRFKATDKLIASLRGGSFMRSERTSE